MIVRFQKCVGWCVPIGRKHQLEVWTVPKGEVIKPHVHKNIDSFIIALWGRQKWTVKETVRTVLGPIRRRVSTGRLTIASQSIPAGVRHGFTALTFSMLINLERTTRGVSAATDFMEVP